MSKQVLSVILPVFLNGKELPMKRITFVDLDRLEGLMSKHKIGYDKTQVSVAINNVLDAEASEHEGFSYGTPSIEQRTYFITNGTNLTKAVLSELLKMNKIEEQAEDESEIDAEVDEYDDEEEAA